MSDKLFIKGTLILTLTGLVSRLMGFFYRIFLSHTIGAQGVGIYQLTLPVHAIVLAACCMGIQAAISRLCASFTALGKEKESRDALLLGTFLSMALCGLLSFLVYWNADFVASALLKEPRTAVLLRILAFSFPFAALHSCVNSFYYARKTTGIPAFILLLEQTSRIGSTYVIYLILISQKKEITPVIAAGGALFSELTATAACMLALGLDFSRENYKPAAGLLRRILRVFSLYEQRHSQKFTFCCKIYFTYTTSFCQKQYCHFHKCSYKRNRPDCSSPLCQPAAAYLTLWHRNGSYSPKTASGWNKSD